MTDPKNNGIKDLIQQSITILQDEVASSHSINMSKQRDLQHANVKCDVAVKYEEHIKENSGIESHACDSKLALPSDFKPKGNIGVGEVDIETYCKLGHLHLLLTEYYEGNFSC